MARIASALLAWCLVSSLHDARAAISLHHHVAGRISMACEYAIDAYAEDAAALPRIVEEAFDEVDRIDRLMSNYKADSPLSRINREAAQHPVVVEPELFDFIVEAMRYHHDSDGAFDITVGPLMKAWGFFRGEGRLPSDEALGAARRLVGGAHVTLNRQARTIAFDAAGVELDLGGIAKGYAVDRVTELLRRQRVAAALISAGGSTIYALGAPPGFDGWQVELQDPIDSRKPAFLIMLKDRALSVAGSSEKAFEAGGVRYSHIMDPRTGKPAQGVLSVAVLTGNGTAGDALDNAFFVLGPERSRGYLKRLHGRHGRDRQDQTEAIFFLPDGERGWRVVREK